jgi:hypothetical protein
MTYHDVKKLSSNSVRRFMSSDVMSTTSGDASNTRISEEDEQRLRELANGIAKDIEDMEVLLKRGGFTQEDYELLCETRAFRQMLEEACGEWQGANNTPKRVKLKAATNIELALPSFYNAMVNPNEPLSSRVKTFEVMARIGGLGNPEPALVGGGNAFNLTIQLTGAGEAGKGARGIGDIVIGGIAEEISPAGGVTRTGYPQSALLAALPLEEF